MPQAAKTHSPVAIALNYLGLTEAGADALMRAVVTGKLRGGVAADKLVADGFARRFQGVSQGWGRSSFVTPKGHEAARVLRLAGWRRTAKKRP